MSAKARSVRVHIRNDKDGTYLVFFDMKRKCRFHAFIGTSFDSEYLAKEALENGLKSNAIPQGSYSIA